jgi:hypothetical protein
MEVSGQLLTAVALPQGKGLRCPLHRRVGGPQSQSGREGEEKKLRPLPEIEPRSSSPYPRHYTVGTILVASLIN